MTRLELSISLRYLRSRRGPRLLSLISLMAIGGVTVAVSALIIIIGVMNGLQTDLREKILSGSPDIRVQPWGADMSMPDWRTMLETVRAQQGVVAAGPFVYTQAVVRSARHKRIETVIVEGLPPAAPGVPDVTGLRSHATSGDFSFATLDGASRGAVLGYRLAERLGVAPGGDSIQVLTVSKTLNPVTGEPMPNSQMFAITGIFDTGLYEYDNSFVITSLSAAQQLAQLDDAVSGIEVKTPTRDAAPAIGVRLADTLGATVKVVDWHQQNNPLFSALRLEKAGMTLILLIIVLVAAFNIISTLVMVVNDKTREIGILRAMGMPAKSIRRVFFAQGIVIGVVGTTLGLIVGIVVSEVIGQKKLIRLEPTVYFIDHLPVATQWGDVTLIVLSSLAIAALATIYPSRRAANLYPLEAIRHE